jgi:hypothetical protein
MNLRLGKKTLTNVPCRDDSQLEPIHVLEESAANPQSHDYQGHDQQTRHAAPPL